MINFKPTYLYIKQHAITKLLYFGKTYARDPNKYLGSGIHWKRHIAYHGKEHVLTLWYCLFTDKEELIKFAAMFSSQENITDSNLWANLKSENGMDGWPNDTKHTTESKVKMSVSHIGKKISEEQKYKTSLKLTGRKYSQEHCKNISEGKKGKCLSPEAKANISKSIKGKKINETTRDAISRKQSRPCTIDNGVTIFRSVGALAAKLGYGKLGKKNPNLRYINTDDYFLAQSNPEYISPSPKKIKGLSHKKLCTIDGIKIYSSVGEMAQVLGRGKNGTRNPNFKFVQD